MTFLIASFQNVSINHSTLNTCMAISSALKQPSDHTHPCPHQPSHITLLLVLYRTNHCITSWNTKRLIVYTVYTDIYKNKNKEKTSTREGFESVEMGKKGSSWGSSKNRKRRMEGAEVQQEEMKVQKRRGRRGGGRGRQWEDGRPEKSVCVCSPRLGERETDRGTAVDCGGERQREGKEEDIR